MQSLILRFGWAIIAIGSLMLFCSTALYLSFRSDINFLLVKPDLVFDLFWRTAFYIHIIGGMLALLVGPPQFLKKFRSSNLQLHRTLGKIYIASILFIAGPSGLYMAFFANGGFLASMGFTLLSLSWMATTYLALEKIRKGNVAAHKAWMIRSFALTFSAVTLRIWVPVCSLVFGVEHDVTIIGTAWLSWIPNLLVAELLIRFLPQKN